MNAVVQALPSRSKLARVETGAIRIDVERVAGTLQVRIQSRFEPAGASSTPSIGIELIPADARVLAALLVSQADATDFRL